LARALLARSDVKGARQQLEVALAAGYRAAAIDLASLLVDPAAAMLDPSRAAALDQKAWQDKVPIAAFELGRLYEAGVLASRPGAPGKLESDPATAWDWYEKGASVGEPNALARLAARAERNALDQADRSLRNSGLLDAFRLYAAAAERARTEDWPDEAWEAWRHRRASLARILAREGLMQEVADAYGAVLTGGPQAR
jgi:TPR repeat protein